MVSFLLTFSVTLVLLLTSLIFFEFAQYPRGGQSFYMNVFVIKHRPGSQYTYRYKILEITYYRQDVQKYECLIRGIKALLVILSFKRN